MTAQEKQELETLREENQRLKKALPPKESLYDKIPFSLKTMDRIIAGLIVLLIFILVIALLDR